jgi:hypothetical protein
MAGGRLVGRASPLEPATRTGPRTPKCLVPINKIMHHKLTKYGRPRPSRANRTNAPPAALPAHSLPANGSKRDKIKSQG